MASPNALGESSRFVLPSSPLRLTSFAWDLWRRQVVALGLSLLVHVLAAIVAIEQRVPKTYKVENQQPAALVTRFIQREPRMLTPFEAEQIPAPKPRELRRAMELITVKARVGWGSISFRWPVGKLPEGFQKAAIEGLDLSLMPAVSEPFVISSRLGPITMYPYPTWGSPVVWRAQLDLLTLDALDFGRYHALAVQNPRDKREIEGFYHLAQVYVTSIMRADGKGPFPQSRGIHRLVQAVSEFTGIRCDLLEQGYPVDDPEVLKVPLIYLVAYGPFKLQPNETNALGRYLLSGGLIFAEDGRQDIVHGPATQSLKQMLQDALGIHGYRRGQEWTFKRLAPDHPLYRAFFDFDGPPVGDDAVEGSRVIGYLEGVTLGDRLVAVVSRKEIGKAWGDFEERGIDPTRQLQFGVNLVVFALTQPESITDRAMGKVVGVE